ncbi:MULTISPECIES: methyl-accepting chemotaxis protein [unclassified Pseudomonas]|uniref:methyl-accepting chemotaxis protein n=2 Tax=unclassified Pseudomonas TaxID=196821 RepID=UPI002AB5B1E4|nr:MULTISPECIES: methyl-accepting chemotaxis protein [unclassified Pseudomonas]MDY7560436.1 methyl-accepting chemotaxis protein [Pseudomonas sp. AB6]MEA9977352.1 methyl-accepting chemotaxis protein [Pseudomonas sp. RTS4]MEA9993194.1 methyl-accepting chemotaxis protein [Pseudomonas sp. AA4]MEB0043099.1 methyl-accepting chemotaxis protein [Pseudomonas sp. MH10]MEB0077729.1 methyl-accepting chemotaxis protein [Pseudomonas sp. MH10out]
MNLNIARLMFGSATTMVLVALGLSLWTSSQVERMDELGYQSEKISEAREVVQELRYHAAQVQQFYTDASLTSERDSVVQGHQNSLQAVEKLNELKTLIPELGRELEISRGPIEALDRIGDRMFQAYSASGKAAGDKVMEDFDKRSEEVIENFSALHEPLVKKYQANQDVTAAVRKSLKLNNLLAWGLVLVFMLITLWLINRRVLPPLNHLSGSLRKLSAGSGDLRVVLHQENDDEIGVVVADFNQFIAGLRGQIATVAEVGNTLGQSSGYLVSDALAAEQSAEVLRVEIEQVATAINQMAATVQGVASNARASAAQTEDADREAKTAIGVVNQTIDDIRTLAEEMREAAEVIQALQTHSQSIGGVLEVIRNIADQTNLLALNAAIEAARAGEQGRGFAVVADEVRTLASRTQASTQEIQSMIERLQSVSQHAVKVMQESREHAENGVARVETAGQALINISVLVASISKMSLHIAEAAREQSTVSDEINQRITNVANVAGHTAKLSESTLARGRAAGEDAQRLGHIVSLFQH